MKTFALLYFALFFLSSAAAQHKTDFAQVFSPPDTATALQDTTLQTMEKDSISTVTPIPEVGAVEPFGKAERYITHTDITWHEYRSLYDILASQHGIFVRDIASPGQQNQIFFKGVSDRNISIMVDGIPYNDYFTGTFNLWLVPVEAIQRIEYIPGTGSIFYDGKSAGATINIMTMNYNNNRALTQLRYSQGVSGYVHTDAFFAQNILRDLNLTLGLSHYGYGSNKESQGYRGRFRNSNNDSWIFRTKLRYNITDWFNLSFFYLYNKTWTGLHGGVDIVHSPSIFNGLEAIVQNTDSYEKQSNSQRHLTAAYYPFPDSTILATLSFYSFDRLREYRDEENRNGANGILKAMNYPSFTNGIKFQLKGNFGFNNVTYYTHYTEVKKQHKVTVGLKDELQFRSFFSLTPFFTAASASGNTNVNAGMLTELSLMSTLILFGGFSENMMNDHPDSPDVFLPQEEIGYPESFSTKEIGAKFILGERFTSKISFQQINVTHPVIFDTIQISNPSLFALKDTYTYNTISASAHFTIGKFHVEGTGNYFNQPALVRNGVNIKLYPDITLDGSFYFHGLLANGNLDLKVGVKGRYFSEQTGMTLYNETGIWLPSSLLRYGPSGTVDFFAIGKIGNAYVHLIWENLTNNEYLLAPVYPMYERNIRFGLTWEFLD